MREGRTCIATIFLSVDGPCQIWAQTVPGRCIETHGPITSGFSRRLTSVAMSSAAKASRALCVRARRMITGLPFRYVMPEPPYAAAERRICPPTRLNVLRWVRWVRGERAIVWVGIGCIRGGHAVWIPVALRAEGVAMATDLAEVIGGAVALYLLFDLPLLLGGLIAGLVSLALLAIQNRRGQRPFERVITGLLVIIAVGFLAGLFVAPPSAADVAAGLVPRFDGLDSVLLATAMLGATVMPHVVYLHSALTRDLSLIH